VVQLGYTCCKIVPIVNHQVMHKYAKTINVGTKNVYDYLCTQMYFKYNHLNAFLDHATLSMVYNKFLRAALDYEPELEYLEKGITAFKTAGYVHPLIKQKNDYWLENG
jgi:actin-related protein